VNSFQQLNSYGNANVTYTSGANANIVWGNSLGNGTIISNVSVTHALQNRQPLITFNGATRPIVVGINASSDAEGTTITNVEYIGNNANIVLTQVDILQWTLGNIWSTVDYSDAFSNSRVSIDSLRTEDFNYQTSITDQVGNNFSFYTNVDVIPFGMSYPTSVGYSEDSAGVLINPLEITDLANYNYTLSMSIASANSGNLLLGNSYSSNSFSVTGNTAVVNPVIANVRYVPYADQTSTIPVNLIVYNNSTSNAMVNANISMVCTQTHADFSSPTFVAYTKVGNSNIGTTSLGNIRITDLATSKNYSSTLTAGNIFGGNLYIGNTAYGNTLTLTGNITGVNANLANIKWVPSGNIANSTTIQYTQTQTTNSILQGNISIPLNYVQTTAHIESAGVEKDVLSGSYPLDLPAAADFWVYKGNIGATPTGFYNGYYDSVTVSNFRNTTDFIGPTSSISVGNLQGATSRVDSISDPYSASTFEMWVKPQMSGNSYVIGSVFCSSAGSPPYYVGGGIRLEVFQGQLYGVLSDEVTNGANSPSSGAVVQYKGPAFNTDFWYQRVVLNDFSNNAWNHIAVMRTAGTNDSRLYIWVNGIQQNEQYGRALAENGYYGGAGGPFWNWTKGCFNRFTVGATNMPNSYSGSIVNPGWTTWRRPFIGLFDNIKITQQAVYTPGTNFTPSTESAVYAGNVTQFMNGI
jgi:hypothetical protein